MGPAILEIREGAALVVDADNGVLRIAPNTTQLMAAEKYTEARRARRTEERAAAQRECRTADGVRIEMLANVGSVADARSAPALGAEGCGLLRTEFLFMDRNSAPTVDEQLSHYRAIADAFAGKPVAIRTLDIGGDKPVAYIQLPREENPALGLRGIRISLQEPQLLREQLTAILRVESRARCRILVPMINGPADVQAVRAIVDELRRELGRGDPIPIGAMIETPAAALCAHEIAGAADFLSIGTNDLTQYTLAIDRGHPQLSAQFDLHHPAVLRLIAMVVEAARAQGKLVAVCGGLASDPTAVLILIGLGIRELSAVPAAIPQLKALIGTLTIQDCVALAAAALAVKT
jgi:phosphocarrier protein FPr